MLRIEDAQAPRLAVRYPHMMREDIIIWQRFIVNDRYIPDRVWYDVRCGVAVEVPEGSPGWMTKMAAKLTRKRIDVVAQAGNVLWIVEIKPKASYVAFGQVVFYAYQFQKDYSPGLDVLPVILTDLVDPDIVPLCRSAGVVVIEVGDR